MPTVPQEEGKMLTPDAMLTVRQKRLELFVR
jgi:hypothetical protein